MTHLRGLQPAKTHLLLEPSVLHTKSKVVVRVDTMLFINHSSLHPHALSVHPALPLLCYQPPQIGYLFEQRCFSCLQLCDPALGLSELALHPLDLQQQRDDAGLSDLPAWVLTAPSPLRCCTCAPKEISSLWTRGLVARGVCRGV